MIVSKTLQVFFTITITMLLMDLFWLGQFALPLQKTVYPLLNVSKQIEFKVIPAFISYFIMASTLTYFTITFVRNPKILSKRALLSIKYGVLWGLISQGVYNFTLLAVLDRQTWRIALTDLLWGLILGTTTIFIGSFSS